MTSSYLNRTPRKLVRVTKTVTGDYAVHLHGTHTAAMADTRELALDLARILGGDDCVICERNH